MAISLKEKSAGASLAPEEAPARRGQAAASAHGFTRAVETGGRRGYVLRRLLAAGDLLALGASYLAMTGARALLFDREPFFPGDPAAFVLLLPLWIALGTLMKLYHVGDRGLDYSVSNEIGPIVLVATVWNWVWLIATALADPAPVLEVLPFILLWGATLVLVPLTRVAVVSLSRKARWYRQRVLVIGTERDASQVLRRIERHPEYALEVAAVVEPPEATDGADVTGNGNHELSLTDHLVALARDAGASRVIITTAPASFQARSELLACLTDAGIQVDVVSGDPDLCASSAAALHFVEGLPVLTVPSIQIPRTWKAVKTGIDLAAAAVLLIVLAPVFGFCALGVKLSSPGPVFFRQSRVGRRGKPFEVLKFRTMIDGADERKDEVHAMNMHARAPAARQMFKVERDPRITGFGSLLRRWSLDELPQIWNVLKGEMSLVGPRPLIPEEAELVEGRYEVRLEMRPGITGPWQTLGRSDIGFDDMVKLDYTYVMNWTLGEDFKLIIRTVETVLRGHGAY